MFCYFSQGCANWVRYDKTFSFGGVEQPQLLDLNACLTGCARNPNCYAVDVETPVIKCYFHLDPNFESNTYSGVPTQYRIDRTCIGTGKYISLAIKLQIMKVRIIT